MKNLSIIISDEEIEKFGIHKTNLSFSELMSIIKNELIGEDNRMVGEPMQKYDHPQANFREISMKARKKTIIRSVDRIDNDIILRRLENILNEIALTANSNTEVFRPSKHDISVEEMIKVQKYKGIDLDTFDRLIRELDIREPLDELLKSV